MKIKSLFTGNFLTSESLRRRIPLFIAIFVITVFHLFVKFKSNNIYRELIRVEKQLQAITATESAVNAERVRITREVNLVKLLKKKKINLIKRIDPPIKMTKE